MEIKDYYFANFQQKKILNSVDEPFYAGIFNYSNWKIENIFEEMYKWFSNTKLIKILEELEAKDIDDLIEKVGNIETKDWTEWGILVMWGFYYALKNQWEEEKWRTKYALEWNETLDKIFKIDGYRIDEDDNKIILGQYKNWDLRSISVEKLGTMWDKLNNLISQNYDTIKKVIKSKNYYYFLVISGKNDENFFKEMELK